MYVALRAGGVQTSRAGGGGQDAAGVSGGGQEGGRTCGQAAPGGGGRPQPEVSLRFCRSVVSCQYDKIQISTLSKSIA